MDINSGYMIRNTLIFSRIEITHFMAKEVIDNILDREKIGKLFKDNEDSLVFLRNFKIAYSEKLNALEMNVVQTYIIPTINNALTQILSGKRTRATCLEKYFEISSLVENGLYSKIITSGQFQFKLVAGFKITTESGKIRIDLQYFNML